MHELQSLMKVEMEKNQEIERAKIRLMQMEIEIKLLTDGVEYLRTKKEELLDDVANAEDKRSDLKKEVQA